MYRKLQWHKATHVLWLNTFTFIYRNSQFATAYLSPSYWLHLFALMIRMKGCRQWRNINHILCVSSGTKILRWQMRERKGPCSRFLIPNSFPRNMQYRQRPQYGNMTVCLRVEKSCYHHCDPLAMVPRGPGTPLQTMSVTWIRVHEPFENSQHKWR
jgi:hypothetical protein